jgi:hypothetical protein
LSDDTSLWRYTKSTTTPAMRLSSEGIVLLTPPAYIHIGSKFWEERIP